MKYSILSTLIMLILLVLTNSKFLKKHKTLNRVEKNVSENQKDEEEPVMMEIIEVDYVPHTPRTAPLSIRPQAI